jgi:hypothetical protein
MLIKIGGTRGTHERGEEGVQGFSEKARRKETTWDALMTEAASTSKTSVDIQLITRQYIPEDSELRSHLVYNELNASLYAANIHI